MSKPTPSPTTASSSRRTVRRALLIALGNASLQGPWALCANLSGGTSAGLRAGLAQACLSFVVALVQVALLETLFRVGRTPGERFCAAVFGTSGILVGTGAIAHTLAGTQHVLASLAPAIVLGLTFNSIYASRLQAAAKAARSAIPACA